MTKRKAATIETDTVADDHSASVTNVKPDTFEPVRGVETSGRALAPADTAPLPAALRTAPPTLESIVRARALELALGALETLAEIAGDSDVPASARVSAANSILDRGIGKSVQQVSTEVRVGPSSGFLSALKATQGMRGKVIDNEPR